MTELLTSAQMRAIEGAAIASGEVTGLELMERAGRGVVEAIFKEWPELAAGPFRVVVLCGSGGNGGDGFVVARLLKEWGWEVEVFLYGDPKRMPPDARANYERWRGMGAVLPLGRRSGADVAVFVDALFGAGLTRELAPEVMAFADHLFETRGRTFFVTIDILSGICADSGRVIGARALFPYSELTVTFHWRKPGHYLANGVRNSGVLRTADIGLEIGLRDDRERCVILTNALRAGLNKSASQHKYSHGHALILSGPSGRGGAARLGARGALRIGAGVVTVGCTVDAIPENAARLDAVMLRGVEDAAALAKVLEDQRINALCLGPGMGVARAKEMLAVALKPGAVRDEHAPYASRRCVVLDADALTALAEVPVLFAMLHEACVLTPHGGEFARLFPDIAAKLAAPAVRGPAFSKVDATREAAARAGCVVLFKGADTVIADPSGRCSINSAVYDRAAPWLATAGAGDVLAGFIVGLLARGFDPMRAAETAAWLHVECARSFGPGLIAEDLPEELPKVFRALGL